MCYFAFIFPDCRQCQFLLLFTTTLNSCNTISVFSNTITVLKFSIWVIWTGQHIAPPDLPVFPLRWLWFWTVLRFRRELPELKKEQIKLLRTVDNCVDKVLLDNFLSIQDKIKSSRYDMWSFDTKLTKNLSTETRLTAVTVEQCGKTIQEYCK